MKSSTACRLLASAAAVFLLWFGLLSWADCWKPKVQPNGLRLRPISMRVLDWLGDGEQIKHFRCSHNVARSAGVVFSAGIPTSQESRSKIVVWDSKSDAMLASTPELSSANKFDQIAFMPDGTLWCSGDIDGRFTVGFIGLDNVYRIATIDGPEVASAYGGVAVSADGTVLIERRHGNGIAMASSRRQLDGTWVVRLAAATPDAWYVIVGVGGKHSYIAWKDESASVVAAGDLAKVLAGAAPRPPAYKHKGRCVGVTTKGLVIAEVASSEQSAMQPRREIRDLANGKMWPIIWQDNGEATSATETKDGNVIMINEVFPGDRQAWLWMIAPNADCGKQVICEFGRPVGRIRQICSQGDKVIGVSFTGHVIEFPRCE